MIPIRFGRAAVFLACVQAVRNSRSSAGVTMPPGRGGSWAAARRPRIQEADDDESTARQPHDGPPAPADALLRGEPPALGGEDGRPACPPPAPLPLHPRGLPPADHPP